MENKLPWLLVDNIENKHHLLGSYLSSVECCYYDCTCGKKYYEIFLKGSVYSKRCKYCNQKFFEAHLNKHLFDVLSHQNIAFNIQYRYKGKYIYIEYQLDVPTKGNYSTLKLEYEIITVFTYKYNILTPDLTVPNYLEKDTRKIIYHALYKNANYVLNTKNEKSLKRLYFIDLKEYKLSKIQTYFMVTRIFNDINICVQVLHRINLHRFYSYIQEFLWFFHFMKFFYTELQLQSLIMEINNSDNEFYFKDTLLMIKTLGNKKIKKHFSKCKCSIVNIHNSIQKCSQFININLEERFRYRKSTLDIIVSIDGLEFELPLNTKELNDYSEKLNNCLWGYGEKIIKNESIIVIVKKSSKALYAIELEHNKIVQMSGVNNIDIPTTNRLIIDRWAKRFNFIIDIVSQPFIINYEPQTG